MNGINKEAILGDYINAKHVAVGESYTIRDPQLEALEAIRKELSEIKELLKPETTTWISKEDGLITHSIKTAKIDKNQIMDGTITGVKVYCDGESIKYPEGNVVHNENYTCITKNMNEEDVKCGCIIRKDGTISHIEDGKIVRAIVADDTLPTEPLKGMTLRNSKGKETLSIDSEGNLFIRGGDAKIEWNGNTETIVEER